MTNQLSYDEAMREALKIKRSGQAPGVSLQQLIKNIMLPAGPGQNANPVPEGIGGVYEPVSVAAPQPVKVVTPASPAPIQEGVEIKAPPLPQQYENPLLTRARQQQRQLAAMPVPGDNASVDQLAAFNLAKARAARAQGEADITEAARIRPEEEQVFAEREARTAEKLAQLEKDRKSSKWKALAEAGFKMAQSNSPYFMQALASGMEAGVKGYDSRKAKMDEEESLLKDQSENLKLGRIRAIDAARAQALDAYRNGDKAALQDMQMLDAARKDVITGKTSGAAIETANMGPQVARAEITQKQASAARDEAAADLARRTDPNIRASGAFGGTGLGTKGGTSALSALIRQEAVYQLTINDPLASTDEKAEARTKRDEVRRQIAWVKASMGFSSGDAASPAGAGALKPDAVYDPKTGYRPLK
jgi:hypothetical protein